jgi:hypothetical protein
MSAKPRDKAMLGAISYGLLALAFRYKNSLLIPTNSEYNASHHREAERLP